MTVSRLDGSFGVNGLAPEIEPASVGWPGSPRPPVTNGQMSQCKAIDLDYAFNSPEVAAGLIVEEMSRRGPAEVGLTRQGRTVLKLEPVPKARSASRQALRLERGDVVAISGGARGITAEVAVALAESFQPRLVILGRSPAPVPEADWLAEIHDEPELKRALLERSGRSRTLRELGEQARQIMAEREVRRTLARIEAAGSPVVYRSVDVRDGAAVRTVLESVRREFGTIRADSWRRGPGRPEDHRSNRFTVRAGLRHQGEGVAHLLEAIDLEALGLLVLFSSSTARFGRSVRWPTRLRTRPSTSGPSNLAYGSALSGRLLQLGPLGRRNGHGRPQTGL